MDTVDREDILIELKDLWFSYGEGQPVLKGLNITLRRGEKLALRGPNGSGKTTLFYVAMGLLHPSSGIVRILGLERKDERDFHEVRRRVGLLFQDSEDQLFSPTVAEDVAFGPLNLGVSGDEVKRVVSRTLNHLGLMGYEERVTYKLSWGEKRLVALATVLAMNPEVLLLDEPVEGLDEGHTGRLIEILKMSTKSMIIISHDQGFLNSVTDKGYILKDGVIT